MLRLLTCLLAILLCACASKPVERRSAEAPHSSIARAARYRLVDVRAEIPRIAIDLRYTTAKNVAGKPIYPPEMPCLLRNSTVQRLKRAQAELRSQGYGIRIWDAWRPPEAQVTLQRSDADGMFLAPKNGWSRHCAGVSLDATLVDKHGVEQRMPTYFDEDLQRATTTYTGNDPVVQRNLFILHRAMRRAGLIPLPREWWHFDDIDFLYKPQPIIFGHEIGL